MQDDIPDISQAGSSGPVADAGPNTPADLPQADASIPLDPPDFLAGQPGQGPEAEVDERILVEWNKKQFEVVCTQYADNENTCIVLLNPNTGSIEAKASVNLAKLPLYRVHIKNYSENRGIAEVLTSNRLVQGVGAAIRNGSEEFEEFEILPRLGKHFGIETPDLVPPLELDESLTQDISGEEPSAGPQYPEETDSPTTHSELEAQHHTNLVQKAQAEKAEKEQLERDAKTDPPATA